MFTGIVQGTGCVDSVSGNSIVTLGIQIPSTEGLDVGASVSIDGVCLTATSVGETVTFHDRDASFTVNRGDYFVINATAAGTEEGGWTMFIRALGASGTTELAAMPLPATE